MKDYEDYANELFERFDLSDKPISWAGNYPRACSKGKHMLWGDNKAQGGPFDEPMIGLDPKAIKEFKKLFTELKDQGCSILISTHIIDTIKDVWDRILIMNKGQIVSNILRSEVGDEDEIEERYFAATGGSQ